MEQGPGNWTYPSTILRFVTRCQGLGVFHHLLQTGSSLPHGSLIQEQIPHLTRTYMGTSSRNGTKVTKNKERQTTCGLSGMHTLRGRARSIHFIAILVNSRFSYTVLLVIMYCRTSLINVLLYLCVVGGTFRGLNFFVHPMGGLFLNTLHSTKLSISQI